MAVQITTNNAKATLAGGISSGATSLTLATGKGALFPALSGGDWFMLTLTQAVTETSWEIVKVTARSGDVLTIVRAQEGTTAAAWATADKAELRLTAGLVNRLATLDDAQTLANKTLTAPNIEQIVFPATQVPSAGANTLDDYEEGTFTATLTGTTTAPTTPVTSIAYYTKIGNLVTVNCKFYNVSTVGAAGNIRITGLPFVCNANIQGIGSCAMALLGSTVGFSYVRTGSANIDIYSSTGFGAVSMVATTGVFLQCSVSYFV